MGRRARARGAAPARAAAPSRRTATRDTLPAVRRVLVAYVGGAMVLSVLVLLGIAGLGGTLGPAIVLAVALVWAGALHRWAQGRLAEHELTDQDRVMQTMGGGMLFLSVCLSATSVLLVALL